MSTPAFRLPLHRLLQQTARSLVYHKFPPPQHLPHRILSPPARTLLTSRPRGATLATPNKPPAHPTVLAFSPSPDVIKHQDPDIDLIPPQDVCIEITDRAAEQLREISSRENNPNAALRVTVESGGCHGYQYKMELATTRSPDDYHFTHPTLKPSNILVDAISLSLLNGSTIDFATELIGSSFRVLDNPQAKGSGCGCGVSWELKMSPLR